MTSSALVPPPTHADRIAEVSRNTAETRISVRVNLDGTGQPAAHRHRLLRPHAGPDRAPRPDRPGHRLRGDLHIDGHHTVEDVGITLGQAFARPWATRRASAATAMPTCRWTRRCRAWWSIFRPPGPAPAHPVHGGIGGFDTQLVYEFFQGFVNHAGVTLHIDNLKGINAHHQCETMFKAFARALRCAGAIRARRRHSVHQGRL
jgi:imidazoleglycerol-phosphate dehydratase